MSSPSTPRATTRPTTASPAQREQADTSPQILTPGKKIKAMLSAFDESDSENEPEQRMSSRSDGNPAMQLDDVDGEEDEEETLMPRGRMAARMQGQGQGQGQTDSDSKVADDGDKQETAFERVSRMIRAEKKEKEVSESRPEENSLSGGDKGSDDEEEEDIVAPRGRMAGRMQTESAQDDATGGGQTISEHVSATIPETKEVPAESQVENEDTSPSDEDDDIPTAGRRKRPVQTEEGHESQSRARSFSPLFMSSPPAIARQTDLPDNQSDAEGQAPAEEQPQLRKGNARFQALVAQKRKEREEKEKAEAEKKAARAKQTEQFSSEVLSGDDSGDDNAQSGRKFTQQSRPARKASKKAIEEMHRETQRMSRNMQLTHQMQTKKKITKDSLFARFNFMQDGPAAGGSSATASSLPSSGADVQKEGDTPGTSPMAGPQKESHTADTQARPEAEEIEDIPKELPTLEELLSQEQEHAEKPAGQVEAQKGDPHPESVKPNERRTIRAVPVRVRLSRQSVAQAQKQSSDSDDDLEVVTSPGKCRRIAAFENLPARKAQESAAMTKLKALAHLTSPTRRNASMNAAELSASLMQKAKQQAAQERRERIQDLRDKGIIIETAEDRAAMEDSVEDLMERARKEGVDIAKREKAARQGGDAEDEEDDADFELSGSDEEGYGDDEDEGDGEANGNGYVENEANEDNESDDDEPEVMSEDDADVAPQRKRPTRVISDAEDEEAPRTPAKQMTQAVGSAERPHFPDLPGSHGLTMSLTQAFAGTLGDNRTQEGGLTNQNSIPSTLPDPAQPAGLQEGNSQEVVKDSQEHRAEYTDLLAGYTQADPRVSESPAPQAMSSQVPEPTQDAGFVLSPFDPSKRFMGTPTSTIETVLVENEPRNDSSQKKRLLKPGQGSRLSPVTENQNDDFEIDASAFDVMKKNKKPSTPFDKKKSKAKEVVEDAAEESDDEYAGLGGGSDDSEDEEDGYDQHMINDNSGETVDEKELAALNAIHDRTTDEKQVAKLLKDINSGALRRRRGPDDEFDLDDSDDERLARRREKQREFARMRKALLADEKVGQIAENPKKAAFFKAIEDRDEDDEVALDFLEEPAQNAQESPSQNVQENDQGQSVQEPKENPASEANKRKRPLEPSVEDITNRPPPHLRRKPASAMSKKPANLAEIRETVSFLTEMPEYDSFHETASTDEHAETADKTPEEQQLPINHAEDEAEFIKPTHPRRTRGPVIDRLALLRQASSNSADSTSASASTRFAFHAGSNDVGFRPSFAKRATGSSSSGTTPTTTTSDSNRRVSKAPGAGKNMAKKGSVNYHTAAKEREKARGLRAKERSGKSKIAALLNKHASNTLSALGEGQWD